MFKRTKLDDLSTGGGGSVFEAGNAECVASPRGSKHRRRGRSRVVPDGRKGTRRPSRCRLKFKGSPASRAIVRWPIPIVAETQPRPSFTLLALQRTSISGNRSPIRENHVPDISIATIRKNTKKNRTRGLKFGKMPRKCQKPPRRTMTG